MKNKILQKIKNGDFKRPLDPKDRANGFFVALFSFERAFSFKNLCVFFSYHQSEDCLLQNIAQLIRK
ncbi:MAG: hypothetical protein AAB688_01100 [Patescibacteria group bacterium]